MFSPQLYQLFLLITLVSEDMDRDTTTPELKAQMNTLKILEFLEYRFTLAKSDQIELIIEDIIRETGLSESEILIILNQLHTNVFRQDLSQYERFSHLGISHEKLFIKNEMGKLVEIKPSPSTGPSPIFISGGDIQIEKINPQFNKLLKQLRDKLNKKKNKLDMSRVVFDENKGTLIIGGKKVQLPPFKKEHDLCSALWEYQSQEPVEWTALYEKITGDDNFQKNKEKKKRSFRDTVRSINSRIKERLETEKDFLKWQAGTIRRLF